MSSERYIVIVTGPLGSGKTAVCRLLRERGARSIDLDALGAAVRQDPYIIQQLCEAFGADICDSDGLIVPSRLAERAFVSRDTLTRMNDICFPPIIDRLSSQVLPIDCTPTSTEGLTVIEVPLLPERPELANLANEVIFVQASEKTRLRRAVNRGMDMDDARHRMDLQPSDEEYEELATTTILNEGDMDDLWIAVDSWWNDHASRGYFGASEEEAEVERYELETESELDPVHGVEG